MSKVIALAGKGGVGKSTIATQIIRELSRNDVVLAIDADPNSNLPDKLGIAYDGTIGGLRNDVADNPDDVPAGISKHEYFASHVRSLLAESEKVDMLVMGRPEGAGCYCFTNNVLKECLSDLIPKYRYAVIDNEAGMEHLSRKVIPYADILVLVSDPTVIGITTAARLRDLSGEVGIDVKKTILVINGTVGSTEDLITKAGDAGFSNVFTIPRDDAVTSNAMMSAELMLPDDSQFVSAVRELIKAL